MSCSAIELVSLGSRFHRYHRSICFIMFYRWIRDPSLSVVRHALRNMSNSGCGRFLRKSAFFCGFLRETGLRVNSSHVSTRDQRSHFICRSTCPAEHVEQWNHRCGTLLRKSAFFCGFLRETGLRVNSSHVSIRDRRSQFICCSTCPAEHVEQWNHWCGTLLRKSAFFCGFLRETTCP